MGVVDGDGRLPEARDFERRGPCSGSAMPRDPDFDAFAREFPAAVLALVGIQADGHEASSIAVKSQSRAFDLVFRSPRPGAPIVCMEVQDRGEEDVERSTLIKVSSFCDQEDCWDDVEVVILYSTEAARDAALSAHVGRRRHRRALTFEPERVVLADIDEAQLLAEGGALHALLPLVGRGNVKGRVTAWLTSLVNDTTLTEPERHRQYDFLGRFLSRRTRGRLRLEAKVFLEKLKTVQDMLAEASASARRASILEVLETRLGTPPKRLQATLAATTDLRRLEAANRAAATAESFAEVAKALARPRRSRSKR